MTSSPTVLERRDARTTRKFDSPEQEAFLNLWRTYDRLRIEEDRLFAQSGLSPQQYNALRLLRGAAPEGLATLILADRLVSRAPDITRLLDKLEERRWIRRERSATDRRTVRVLLTDGGRELLQSLDHAVRQCHSRQLGHMPRARLRQLVALLQEARRPHEAQAGPWTP